MMPERLLSPPAAEGAVLGGILVAEDDPGLALVAEDFATPAHRAICSAIGRLRDMGRTPDPIAVADEVSRVGDMDYNDVAVAVAALMDQAARPAALPGHLEVVRSAAVARKVTELSTRTINELARGEPVAGVLARREAELQALNVAGGSRYTLLDDEAVRGMPALEFRVAGVLPDGAFGVLFAPPEQWKTFLALDLALCIGTGFRWQGREVRRGPAVYVSGEGRTGLGARVHAWKAHHHYAGGAGVRFVLEPVYLDLPEIVSEFISALSEMPEPPALVVFDTLARCLAGDENTAQDMGAAIAGLDRIREATGAATLVLHHTPHDATRERGHGSLRGAADVSIRVAVADDVGTVTCAKQKDAPRFARFHLELSNVADSCVLVGAKTALHLRAGELTTSQVQALDALHQLAPPHGLTASQWEEVSELPRRTFYAARNALVGAGYVEADSGRRGALYTLTDKGIQKVGAGVQEGANTESAPRGAKVRKPGSPLGGPGTAAPSVASSPGGAP